MKKILIVSMLLVLCLPLFACNEVTSHDHSLESDSYSTETVCLPNSRTITSDEFLEKVTKGMTKEVVISAVGEPQGQETVELPLWEGASTTFPRLCYIYETSDNKKIYISYGAHETDLQTIDNILVW